jgi:two-component system CheB/CheR fusion protein
MITTPWKAWVFALAVFALATWLNLLVRPVLGDRVPLLPYFPALVLTGFFAGLAPGVAVLLGALPTLVYFHTEPRSSFVITDADDMLILGMFVVAAGMVLGVSSWARSLVREGRENRRRLNMALAAGRMASWDWDVATNQVRFSDGARALFGTTWRQMQDGWALAHPDDVDRIKGVLETALREGTDYSFLSRMRRADTGEQRWIQTHGHVHRDDEGRAVRVIGITADVTSLRAAQEQLRREGERKDAFLATLAHELRNPMAPIRYAVALLREDATPAMREQARGIIARQSAHMARLLDDLLDMSRITRNAITLQWEVFDLRAAAEQAAENVRPLYAELAHRLSVELPPTPVLVNGDPTRLQQVLGNLLDNAAKYTDRGGHIVLAVTQQDRHAVVRVKDNGIGIAPQDQSQVFELFTQLQQPGRGGGGLGIGLAVVKQLVELHGGEIALASEGPGRGSEFTVRLPLARVLGAPVPAGDGSVTALAGKLHSVLVVDDNRDTADSLAAILRAQGFVVTTAYDGAGALHAFESMQPAVVLLDLGLPDMSGHEVAAVMRGKAAPPVLVAITGWGQEEDRRKTSEAGFDLHLVKPVDPAELQAQLSELLERRRAA